VSHATDPAAGQRRIHDTRTNAAPIHPGHREDSRQRCDLSRTIMIQAQCQV